MLYDVLLGYSMGGPALDILIPEKGVVANTVSILSKEGGQIVNWTEVSDISLGRPTQSVFTTYMDDFERTHVLFGDNAAGRIPPVNSEILGSYRLGVGREANSLAAGDLKVLASSTAGADLSDKMWAVKVTNPSSPVGGTDPESIDSMRFSIPRAAGRIKNRAITLNDYADLALQVPGVAKSTAYGTLYTSIHVRIAPQEGKGDTNTMKRLIAETESYLSDKILVGSGVVVEPQNIDAPPPAGLWQTVHIRLTVHVQAAYNRTSVRGEVETVLRELLSFNVVDFGTRVSIGLVYRTALAVQGVEWVDLNWLSTTAPTHTDEINLDTDSDYQNVEEIITDSLLIPKIWPSPPVMSADIINVKVDVINVGTVTTVVAHQMLPGQNIDVRGVSPVVFNGRHVIATVPTPTTMTYAVVSSNTITPTASTGTVATVNLPEAEADFPDLSEEERTHDGLWVKADGGLVST